MEFKDKVVLITGASSGIGAETALHFAAEGASLALTGRDEERLRGVANKCVERGSSNNQVLTITADLSIEDDVEKIMRLTIEKFGKLHVLVNNAGINLAAELLQDNFMEIYDKVTRINIRSLVQLTHLATPHLVKSRGCIINISSLAATRPPLRNMLPYSISKAALDQFTRLLALELGPKGVRVSGINPGCIITPIQEAFGLTPDEVRENFKKYHPIGRVGEVDDVASVIKFLASDGAKFINGASIPVDGGWFALCPR